MENLNKQFIRRKIDGHDMFSLILVAIIPAITTSCIHLGHNCSYFTLSFLNIPPSVKSIGKFKADSQLECALRCCSQKKCTEAVFFKVARRCSLFGAKEEVSAELQADSQTGYVQMKKVG